MAESVPTTGTSEDMDTESEGMTTEGMETEDGPPDTVSDEYAVQYFGFFPQSFMNGMYNCMGEYLKDAMSAMNESIINTCPGSTVEAELRDKSYKLGQDAIERLDDKFDKAEMFLLNNVFNVPTSLVLPGEQPQVDHPCTVSEMEELDAEIQQLTNKIIAVKYANAKLQVKIEEMDQKNEELNSTVSTLENVHSIASSQYRDLEQATNVLDKVKDTAEGLD